MDFRISDTFTDSLAILTGDEQKAVKMTAFDLHLNRLLVTQSLDRNSWMNSCLRNSRLIIDLDRGRCQ